MLSDFILTSTHLLFRIFLNIHLTVVFCYFMKIIWDIFKKIRNISYTDSNKNFQNIKSFCMFLFLCVKLGCLWFKSQVLNSSAVSRSFYNWDYKKCVKQKIFENYNLKPIIILAQSIEKNEEQVDEEVMTSIIVILA